MIELSEVKQYLRISHEVDDDFIENLITMSQQLIEEQTGAVYSEDDKVYATAILLMVAHFYDKRESFGDKSAVTIPYTLDCLIKHIGMREANNE